MKLAGKMRLAGLAVLRQGESGAGRSRTPPGEKNCNLQDHKDDGWCILNRAGESKMEIRSITEGGQEAKMEILASI